MDIKSRYAKAVRRKVDAARRLKTRTGPKLTPKQRSRARSATNSRNISSRWAKATPEERERQRDLMNAGREAARQRRDLEKGQAAVVVAQERENDDEQGEDGE